MPVIILVSVLAVGWTLTGVLYVNRTRALREEVYFLHNAQSEAQDLRIDAERRAATAETEAAFVKQTLVDILRRPVVAGLTEENIQQLGALVQSFMVKPDKLN